MNIIFTVNHACMQLVTMPACREAFLIIPVRILFLQQMFQELRSRPMRALYLILKNYISAIRNLISPGNSIQGCITAGAVSVLGALSNTSIVIFPFVHLNLMVHKFCYIFKEVRNDSYIIHPAIFLISKLVI